MSVPPVLFSGDPTRRAYPGIPTTWSPLMRGRAEADLELACSRLPGLATHVATPDPEADVEDFWEHLAGAAAAIRAADGAGTLFIPRPAVTPLGWNPVQLFQRIGPVASAEEDGHAPDPLTAHDLLATHGGRWSAIAGYAEEPWQLSPDRDLVPLVLGRARAGVERVVVKFRATKTGLLALELEEDMSAEDVEAQLFESEQGWTFVRQAGDPAALLVQDWIPLGFEYRLFVVDGQIVSGAGCIEEHTPYDRIDPSVAFDDRVRAVRPNVLQDDLEGVPGEVVSDPLVVNTYLSVMAPLVEQIGTAVVDVALSKGQVVVVELNPLPNAGLYASSPDAVARALVCARDRGYGPYRLRRFASPRLAMFA